MINRRLAKRRHLHYYLPVRDAITGVERGHLVDVTMGGMMLVSTVVPERGSILEAEIELPHHSLEGVPEEYLAVTCELRWSAEALNPDYFEIGYQFVELSAAAAFKIQDLIADLSFRD